MSPDQLRRDETGAWLDRARRDLRAARLLIAGGANAEAFVPLPAGGRESAQGVPDLSRASFRKTHDLSDLSPECLALDASLQPAISQAEGLTQYAWRFRYPGEPYEPDPAEAQDGLKRAEMAVGEIEGRLPSEEAPGI